MNFIHLISIKRNPEMFKNVARARFCDKLRIDSRRIILYSKTAYVRVQKTYNNLPKEIRHLLILMKL